MTPWRFWKPGGPARGGGQQLLRPARQWRLLVRNRQRRAGGCQEPHGCQEYGRRRRFRPGGHPVDFSRALPCPPQSKGSAREVEGGEISTDEFDQKEQT